MVRKLLLISVIGAVVVAGLWIDRSIRAPKQAHFVRFSGTGQAVPGCVDFHQAASRVGQNGCVTGQVLRAYTSKSGNTFLDFCQDYRSCPFTSVIFSSDRPRFGDLTALEGRVVEIRGTIKTYAGRAEIVVRDPEQIRAPHE
ncbi:MAG: hypothetical protein ACRD3T_14245 [Terriglobia bacterium]